MGLTSRHMLILYREKNVWRFSRKEHACSEHKYQKQSLICRKVMVIYRRKCLSAHLDADLYLFMHFFLKPALLTCRGIALLCLLCTTSIVFFQCRYLDLWFPIGFASGFMFYIGHPVAIQHGTCLSYKNKQKSGINIE